MLKYGSVRIKLLFEYGEDRECCCLTGSCARHIESGRLHHVLSALIPVYQQPCSPVDAGLGSRPSRVVSTGAGMSNEKVWQRVAAVWQMKTKAYEADSVELVVSMGFEVDGAPRKEKPVLKMSIFKIFKRI